MVESYHDSTSRASEPRRRSWLVWLFDGLLTLLTLVVGLTMAVTYLVPYVDPSGAWAMPVLGLAAPATYLATLVLALYWIIRWRWRRAGTMLALVAVGFFHVPLFWHPVLRRSFGEETERYDRRSFKVMSYNVRMFYGDDGRNSASGVAELILEHKPDIVCLQEYNARLAEESEAISLLEEYESTGYGRASHDSLTGAQMVILSKYRILRSGVVLSPDNAIWADLLVDEDTVRVYNNHLRSTNINSSDNAYITSRSFFSDEARDDRFRSMARRLRASSVSRAAQVDSIACEVAGGPRLRIVCGDFNDTPASYAYRAMARGLDDAFARCGSGYSYTYRGFFNTLRIDFVLSSREFDPLSYEVPEATWSDHLPVVVRLLKRPVEKP